jgi:hypothetical protein
MNVRINVYSSHGVFVGIIIILENQLVILDELLANGIYYLETQPYVNEDFSNKML